MSDNLRTSYDLPCIVCTFPALAPTAAGHVVCTSCAAKGDSEIQDLLDALPGKGAKPTLQAVRAAIEAAQ